MVLPEGQVCVRFFNAEGRYHSEKYKRDEKILELCALSDLCGEGVTPVHA
jgi:hypothetical protein